MTIIRPGDDAWQLLYTNRKWKEKEKERERERERAREPVC